MGKFKQIEIKNRTYYFYNDIINIKKFHSSLLKIGKKSYKDFDIYYIGYITIETIGNCENNYSVNPLYLITGKVDGHNECNSVECSSAECNSIECNSVEEKNRSKYLVLTLQMETKKYFKRTQNFGMRLKTKLKQ